MHTPRQTPARGVSPSDFCRPYVQCKPDDRRAHPRLRSKGLVEVRFPALETLVAGNLVNLSVTGCCIETRSAPPEAENAVAEVRLSVNGVRVCVAGVVKNIRRKRLVGIEFTRITQRKAEQIKQLVTEVAQRYIGLTG